MFTAALVVIIKSWEEIRCSSVTGQISCTVYPGNGLLLSAQNNELSSLKILRRNLKLILLSKRSQSKNFLNILFQK